MSRWNDDDLSGHGFRCAMPYLGMRETVDVTVNKAVSPIIPPAPVMLPAHLSPTFQATTGRSASGAFELKFLVDHASAADLRTWACRNLELDRHASSDGLYLVNTLYLDTPDLRTYHRVGGMARRKYRVRRYGREELVWVELKHKRHGKVQKRRTSLVGDRLAANMTGNVDAEWDGRWFVDRRHRLELKPTCVVSYRRFACFGQAEGGVIRMTMDDDLRSRTTDHWEVPVGGLDSDRLLDQHQILELKFAGALPTLFKTLIADFNLAPGSFSKYRTAAGLRLPLDLTHPPERTNAAEDSV